MSADIYIVWAEDDDVDLPGWEISATAPRTIYDRPWATDAEDAAREWARAHWGRQDHPETMECVVRSPDGEITRWQIAVETEPVFSAFMKGD